MQRKKLKFGITELESEDATFDEKVEKSSKPPPDLSYSFDMDLNDSGNQKISHKSCSSSLSRGALIAQEIKNLFKKLWVAKISIVLAYITRMVNIICFYELLHFN